ncbi:MAG: RNA methyltransferase [Bacteroidia bacterium]|nr:RNA methyltransferase [Bacteroidia bacterium]
MRKLKNNELARISIQDYQASDKTPLIIVLDNIRSMNNIGSIFRTCDAFRVESLYLCGNSATPPHRDIHKTALGATESVNWKYFISTSEAIRQLKIDGYTVISIEQTDGSTELQDVCISKVSRYALIFGNEIKGVDDAIIDMSDSCMEIPQFGTKHSLNVAVSAGIIIWELYNKIKAAHQEK